MPVAASDSEFEIEAVDASGRSVPKRCSLRASLPEFPTFRIDAIPATIAAAANGPMVRLELSHAYSLPMQGEFVLSAEADTGSFEPVINQPDPRVRFANGERRLRFTIPAGTTQATAPIVSTGTVASLVTVRAINFSASGVPIPTAPAPRQFRVNRGIPVITDACLSRRLPIRSFASRATRPLGNWIALNSAIQPPASSTQPASMCRHLPANTLPPTSQFAMAVHLP